VSKLYNPCPCGSGKKLKFCCNEFSKMGNFELLAEEICRKCPVAVCYINKGWESEGLANMVVVRALPNENYICGLYLVDLFCLGIKDAGIKMNASADLITELLQKAAAGLREGLEAVDYELVRSIAFGGDEYAARIGFSPHKDWPKAKLILEPDRPFENRVTFGKDGKPLYVNGPYDIGQNKIIRTVLAAGGNFIKQLE